jgi:hypothetical protein
MRKVSVVIALALQWILLIPATGRALELASNSRLDECSRAAQTVQTGSPASGLIAAYNTLAGCPAAVAAPALAAAWKRSVSAEEAKWREATSRQVSDRRVLSAAVAAGTTAGRAATERVSALAVVAQLMKPGSYLTMSFWYHSNHNLPEVIGDIPIIVGDQPITSADRTSALASLDAMATSDSDPAARSVATRLAAFLRRPG